MIKKYDKLHAEAIENAISLMAASARTSPKSKGKDDLEINYFSGKEFDSAIKYMASEEFMKKTVKRKEFFVDSDCDVLKEAEGVLAIGVKAKRALNLNCSKCGCKDCLEFTQKVAQKKDVNCMFKILDLGFAASSACKTAADLNIDNRIMYDIGEAIRLKYMNDCDVVLGIAVSIKGSNIFFDRYLSFFVKQARKEDKTIDQIFKDYRINT